MKKYTKNFFAWFTFQIFGKRKLCNLNKNQKRILYELMKNEEIKLDYNNPDVKDLVKFGILKRDV